jgi:hypothetical protein
LPNGFVIGRSGNGETRVNLIVFGSRPRFVLPNEFTKRDGLETVKVNDLGVDVGTESAVRLPAVQAFRASMSVC